MLPIYLQRQGANVFVAIKAGTGKALRDALGGTRGGEQGQNLHLYCAGSVVIMLLSEDIFYILIFSSI